MEYFKYESNMETAACCRVCLSTTGEFFDLFSGDQLEQGATISQILQECTSYSVDPSDNLSRQICRSCFKNACFAYSFRRQADDSYRYLCGINDEPQKSTMMLCESGTQTESVDETFENSLGHSTFNLAGDDFDGDDKMSLLEPMERKSQRQQRTNKGNVTTDCKLCGAQHDRLLDLREHLMAEHMFIELTYGLQCRLCEKEYSRKDHLVRHLRNIHKVTRDRDNGTITIEEPQTSTLGQWVSSDLDASNESSMLTPTRELDTKSQPKASSTTVHRYWHSPEFVRSGNNTSTYKVKLPKFNNAAFEDPLNADSTALLDVDNKNIGLLLHNVDDNDIKPPIDVDFEATTATYDTSMDSMDKSDANNSVRQNFQCNICYRNFFRKYHLQRHMVTHTKVRAYNCELCNRTFARSDQISRHRKDGCKQFKRDTATDLFSFPNN